MELVDEVRKGSVRALAKLITLVENEMPNALEAMENIYPYTGNAYIIGITGPPGAGKSTLTDKMTQKLRAQNFTVGIVAIDPTSPFTGGALLGDRVRMQGISSDEGVFIRSMATRGSLGGLSRATSDTVKILDAFGKDYIIIETVGVGQDEVDIIKTADVSILVVMPGGGDDIQAIKAGIMEIGDIFVVNKSDREGADRLVTEIKMMLDLSSATREWIPPVLKTIAPEEKGLDCLLEKINEHRDFLISTGRMSYQRKERIRSDIIKIVEHEIFRYLDRLIREDKELFEQRLEDIVSKKKDPYGVSKNMIDTIARRISEN
ncbi:MAG: methylmalonyl Co-A mutase-associated GTPase MeaB [Thermodesulfobacteriota bacterium]|nr:methylmalonyl Co-A mutase-associated GTPase MeaB [Thermodesulfobacteriota bacterium]